MKGRDYISEERRIGKKYAIELRNSFKKQISVLEKQSGKSFKPGYRIRFRDLMLNSIAVRTVNYVFVQHYGVDGARKTHTVRRNGKSFIRKEHPFKLESKVKELMIPEGIVNGLADEISGLRGDQVMAQFDKEFQSKQNFQVT